MAKAKVDFKQFTKDLKTARRLAMFVSSETADGGTCNFDSLELPTGNGLQFGRRTKRMAQAFNEAGMKLDVREYNGCCRVYLNVRMGQGQNRTSTVQAVRKYLEACGWKFSIHYAMD